MYPVLWQVAAGLVGIALGFWSGQFFLAMLVYWKGTEAFQKSFRSLVLFLISCGGGALLGQWIQPTPDHRNVAFYIMGLSIGLILGRLFSLPSLRQK